MRTIYIYCIYLTCIVELRLIGQKTIYDYGPKRCVKPEALYIKHIYLGFANGATESTLEREDEDGYDKYDFVHVDDGVGCFIVLYV
jgi:hypothetical protein